MQGMWGRHGKTQEKPGVRSDVAIKVFGDDMTVMAQSADNIAKVLETI